MYLHTSEYYQRDLQVPNINEASSDGGASDIEVLADGVPRVFLQGALGYTLFKDLDDNVTDGVLDGAAPQKWLDLVNGVEYTKDDVLYKWEGLAYSKGAFYVSILAQITYYNYLSEKLSKTSGVGEVVGKGKNSVNVNSTQKLNSIWNEFVKMNQGTTCHRRPSISYHNGIKFTDWIGDNNNKVSLIMFLQDHAEDYPDAPCETYEIKNYFGL